MATAFSEIERENEATEVYIGTKIVRAKLMTDYQFENYTGKKLVGNTIKDGYKVTCEDGYISWSPKEVFERCYRKLTAQEKELI